MESSPPSLFSSSKSRHTFLDLISSSLSEEDKHKLIHEYHNKNSLVNTGLLETYLAGEPLLLTSILFLLFLTLTLFSLAVIVTTCRFLGKCGGRRYQVSQPFPLSSSRIRFLLLSFLLSWLVLASSSLNFILSTASFFGARNPSQLVSVPFKTLSLDYPDYDRGKRESILTALFNDPDYDFDKIDDQQHEPTTTTTEPSFVQETTQRVVPIGVGTRDPMVVVTRNEDIEERGRSRGEELVDTVDQEEEGEEEEYIEGEDGDEDDNGAPSSTIPSTRRTVTTTLPTVPSTRRTVFSTHPTVPSTRPTVPPTRFHSEDRSPHWTSGIGEGEEWNEILKRGQNLSPGTTRKITIQKMTTTVPTTTTTEPTTTTVPSTTQSTTTESTTSATTTTPRPVTTRRRTMKTTKTTVPTTPTPPSTTQTFPDYQGFELESSTTIRPVQQLEPSVDTSTYSFPPPSVDYPLFDRFDATLNGIASISQSGDSSFHSIVHSSFDSPSLNDPEVIPIQIGRIQQKGKNGRPNISLLSHRRPFDSLHTSFYLSSNRIFGLLLGFVLSLSTLPSLLIVILGAMNYGRGSHPMDRSKVSDMVGVLSVVMSLFLLFVVPLLLFYSTIGLLFSHAHHTLCPLVQPPTETLEDVILVMEGCARVQTPLIRMEQSALMAAISAFPAAIILLQLSNYFLRMSREHYWTHSDCDLM